MVAKRKRPRGRPKPKGWSPVGPPNLANRLCKMERKGPKTPGKKRTARAKKKALTIGQVRGEVKAVGIWIQHVREVMASVKPANKVLTILPTWSGTGPTPPNLVGRLCKAMGTPCKVRASDLVQLLGTLRTQTNAIATQLGGLPKDLEVKRPRRRTPTR
jgi:hypothetical protein